MRVKPVDSDETWNPQAPPTPTGEPEDLMVEKKGVDIEGRRGYSVDCV